MKLDFLDLRIEQQKDQIDKLLIRFVTKQIDSERYLLLLKSARSQLKYFEQERDNYIFSKMGL